MERSLYVVAYDVCHPRRLRNVREILKGYSTGGQKSVFECYLTAGEVKQVEAELAEAIDTEEDRVHIFIPDGRSRVHTLGLATPPRDPEFFYYG